MVRCCLRAGKIVGEGRVCSRLWKVTSDEMGRGTTMSRLKGESRMRVSITRTQTVFGEDRDDAGCRIYRAKQAE